MNKLALLILVVSVFFACNQKAERQHVFSSFEQAKLHPLKADKPAIDFFEGALLGNGAMGAVVTTRPDGVTLCGISGLQKNTGKKSGHLITFSIKSSLFLIPWPS
jgi:hypothetical protein